jgi:siroheme synthase (precorrin-2 oxidase/ferrochelatase)
MALKENPNYNPNIPTTASNQPYIFESPETIINPATGQTAISASSLKPEEKIELPKMPQDNFNYAGLLESGKSMAENLVKTAPQTDDLTSLFQKYLEPPTSTETQYSQLYKDLGIDIKGEDVLAKRKIAQSAKSELDMLNTQMKALEAETQAIPIRLQEEAIGRGITTGGLAPIQTSELRRIALRSLPLQAQILGAQAKLTAAQGDVELSQQVLQMANDRLSTLFQIKTKDAEMQYNYRKEQRERIWDYLTEKEKLQIQNQQKKDDRAYNESRDNLSLSKSWAEKAIDNGQANIAAQIANLNPKDPAFQTKLSELTGKISVLTPEQKTKQDLIMTWSKKYSDAGILPTDSIEVAREKVKNSAIYREEIRPPSRDGGTTTTLTSEDRRILIGAGLTDADINNIKSDINEYGIDKVLEGLNDAQKKAINKVYGVETKEINTSQLLTAAQTMKQDEITNFFQSRYSADQINKFARQVGFGSFWNKKETENTKYLESPEARKKVAELLKEQYIAAGYTIK